MPLVEETGFGNAMGVGRADDQQLLKRDRLAVVGAGTVDDLIARAWPIGSVFVAVVGTNPAALLGIGTWTAIGTGRVLVGYDAGDTDFDADEKTGGAKSITLTTAEMPVHSHALSRIRGSGMGAETTDVTGLAEGPDESSTPISVTTDAAGAGAAHANVQPYFVVHMWKRTG